MAAVQAAAVQGASITIIFKSTGGGGEDLPPHSR